MTYDKYIFSNLNYVADRLAMRGFSLNVTRLEALNIRAKTIKRHISALQAEIAACSKLIDCAAERGENILDLISDVECTTNDLRNYRAELNEIDAEIRGTFLDIPNLPDESVPIGEDDNENIEIRRWEVMRNSESIFADFASFDKIRIYEGLVNLNFKGQRCMSEGFAHLCRALKRFMIDLHVEEHQCIEVCLLGVENSLTSLEEILKDKIDKAFLEIKKDGFDESDPKSSILNLFAGNIIARNARQPLKFVIDVPCTISEFNKFAPDTSLLVNENVVLVQLIEPDRSVEALEVLTENVERVLQLLELPYRVVESCTGALNHTTAKSYKVEVWLPSQYKYIEVATCSNDTDFHTRRMEVRYLNSITGEAELLHSLSATGLLLGPTLMAIIEYYRNKNGCINIPSALRPYMFGVEEIS
ncbi:MULTISPECIES: aminoacyl--tRNA ligase-related protein [unclassified Pseudomonas]|uniref:aminoacyl--tRNA ligase-related protein n=1 Tax=unclassified Pseudomonas TaxID=196821 RepID=UPI000A1DCA4A|nr:MULTISPECIES: aminoacyl--tRNA ligase-related protein [unclassified Pseudomonas]